VKLAYFFTAFFLALLVFGCKDDAPTAVGSKLIPTKDTLQLTTLTPTLVSDSSYLQRSLDNSSVLFFGRSGMDTAELMMQFPTGVGFLSTDSIVSAYLFLRIMTRLKDSTGTIAFQVHQTRTAWDASTITWDTLHNITISDTVLSNVDTALAGADTALTIPLDTTTVHRWDVAGATQSVIVIPTNAMSLVIGCNYSTAYNILPQYIVKYKHKGDTTTYANTLTTTGSASVVNGSLPTNTNLIYCQGGVAFRSKMKFDVSSIPANASITDAILTMYLDPTATVRTVNTHDSIIANIAFNDTTVPKLGGLISYGHVVDSVSGKLTMQVNYLVQQWSARRTNYGLVFRISGENVAMDMLAFEGLTYPDPTRRPKLVIKYTLLP